MSATAEEKDMTDGMILVPRAELLAWAKAWQDDYGPNDGTDCVTPFDAYLLMAPAEQMQDYSHATATKDAEIERLRAELREVWSAVDSKAGWEWRKRAEQAEARAERLAEALRHQRWCRTCGEDGWDNCEDGRAAIDLLRDHAQQPVDCRCIDCGGDQPAHDPTCSYMHELHGDQTAPPSAPVETEE